MTGLTCSEPEAIQPNVRDTRYHTAKLDRVLKPDYSASKRVLVPYRGSLKVSRRQLSENMSLGCGTILGVKQPSFENRFRGVLSCVTCGIPSAPGVVRAVRSFRHSLRTTTEKRKRRFGPRLPRAVHVFINRSGHTLSGRMRRNLFRRIFRSDRRKVQRTAKHIFKLKRRNLGATSPVCSRACFSQAGRHLSLEGVKAASSLSFVSGERCAVRPLR